MACEQHALLKGGGGWGVEVLVNHIYISAVGEEMCSQKYLHVRKTVVPENTVVREGCIALQVDWLLVNVGSLL
jgi:hypothetical protein